MKIRSIRIEHVMRVRDVEAELRHPLTIIAGDNDVGKTSCYEAIRLAFTGEAVRVRLKKDYQALVRQGASSGSATVEWSHNGKTGRAFVAIPSGKQDCSPPCPPALAFILDAQRFASLPEDGRRRFLLDLMKVQTNVASVTERLIKRGCNRGLVQIITPMLRSGFSSAEKYAIDQQQEWRARWREATGEQYGEVKAEAWVAPLTALEYNRKDYLAICSSLRTLEEDERQLQKRIGAAEEYLSTKARYDAEVISLRKKSNDLAETKESLSRIEAEYSKAKKRLAISQEKLADALLSGQACPACGALLGVKEGGKIVRIEAMDQSAVTSLEAAVKHDQQTVRVLEESRAALSARMEEMLAAASALAILEQAMASPATKEDLDDLRSMAASVRQSIAELSDRKREMEKIAEDAKRAKEATERAREAHEKVKAWTAIREAVAPTGIPAEILEEALGPLNERLKQSSKVTGWSQAVLRGDMEIMVDGLPYGLLGESAKWKANAMIAEAISFMSGIKMLVLDRFDVLSVARRSELLDWCEHLVQKDGYETIMLFGTLKDKPQVPDANILWLKDGRVA